MKGIVFTEFLEMVESAFGAEMSDRIILDSDVQSGGAYTSVGTYSYKEMVALVSALSQQTGVSVPELLETFGHHLFSRFAVLYPVFFQDVNNSLDFLKRIDSYIHVEVRKLYPDAELPTFTFEDLGPDKMRLIYRSRRALSDVAAGLIKGCAKHFGEDLHLKQTDLSGDAGTEVEFLITRTTHE